MPADTTPKRSALKPPPSVGLAHGAAPSTAKSGAKSVGPGATPGGTGGALPRMSVGMSGSAPSSVSPSTSSSAAGVPRLSVGTVAPQSTHKSAADSATTAAPSTPHLAAPGSKGVGSKGVGSKGVGSKSTGPKSGSAKSADSKVAGAVKQRRSAMRAAQRRQGGAIPPGHTVKELRRPTGTVQSNAVVGDVMRAIDALAALLTEENEALRKHDIATVKALSERKRKATRFYQERMLKIQKDPDEVTGLPEDERDVVRQMAHYLDALLAENARLLKSAMTCGERLMGLFVDAVRQANTDQASGYAANGRINDAGHNPSRMSLSFNENL